VEETLVDANILDVVIPTRDGRGILAALRRQVSSSNIPVLMRSNLPDHEFGPSQGAAGSLAKPVRRLALMRALATLFEDSRASRLATPLSS
jgi:response regulator RpfG family c-di-GMP phosphodiesterase